MLELKTILNELAGSYFAIKSMMNVGGGVLSTNIYESLHCLG